MLDDLAAKKIATAGVVQIARNIPISILCCANDLRKEGGWGHAYLVSTARFELPQREDTMLPKIELTEHMKRSVNELFCIAFSFMVKCNIEKERREEGKTGRLTRLFSLLPYTWGGGVKERERENTSLDRIFTCTKPGAAYVRSLSLSGTVEELEWISRMMYCEAWLPRPLLL